MKMSVPRAGLFVATLVGFAAATWAIGAAGLGDVLRIVGRLGAGGFALLCGWSMLQLAALGAAWLAVAPGERWTRLLLFTWARVVRESVSDLLPFSQVGGIVIGGRTLTDGWTGAGMSGGAGGGVPVPIADAVLIADLVTEMASQLLITLMGLSLRCRCWRGRQSCAVW